MSRGRWGRAALALLVIGSGCRSAPDAETRVRQALHLPHRTSAPLSAQVDSSWRRRDAVVERVRFDGYHGRTIPALVSWSELPRARPLPILLVMPGSPNRKEDLLRPRALLPLWAQAGFFVLTIDRPYHGERPGDPAEAIRAKGLPRVLGEYVLDLQRALDYAASRPEADAGRIGMMGLSMGGMEALLLASVDERVDCVASVAGQLCWAEVFGTVAWRRLFGGLPLAERLIREEASPDRVREAFLAWMPELAVLDAPLLAASLAPRPLLLMTGELDPYITPAAARRTFAAAAPAYADSAADRLELWIEEDVGHGFSRPMESRVLAWFQRWLEPLPHSH